MSKYINPFTDFGFKKLFGENSSKIYLADFLNSILEPYLSEPIISIENRKSEMLGRKVSDRNAVFDLYCFTQNGERIIVEMQKVEQEYFRDRSLYYSTFAITEQAKKGKTDGTYWDFKLDPVYCVGILNFNFSDKEKYLHIGKILDVQDHDNLIDNVTFAFIEMKKFEKDIKICKTKQDKWLYTLHNIAKLQEVPPELEEQVFIDFFHEAEINALKSEDLGAYQDSLNYFRDLHIIENQNLKKGRLEGKLEGKLEMAKSMKKEGLDIKIIQKISGLKNEDIDKL